MPVADRHFNNSEIIGIRQIGYLRKSGPNIVEWLATEAIEIVNENDHFFRKKYKR